MLKYHYLEKLLVDIRALPHAYVHIIYKYHFYYYHFIILMNMNELATDCSYCLQCASQDNITILIKFKEYIMIRITSLRSTL